MLHEVLHDIGRIGADHQELAVRHVDDADQPICDRKPERREQQHAAEREAREDRAEDFAAALNRIECVDAFLSRVAYAFVGFVERAVGLLRDDRAQQFVHVEVMARRDELRGFETPVHVGIVQRGHRPERVEALL